MNVVHVQLNLAHPSQQDKELEVSLIFNDQPNAAQVFEAFQEVPAVHHHHKDFDLYRRRLFECLETYGIPKLDKFNLITPEGAPITVPMVYAAWCLNLVSTAGVALGAQVGSIRIGRRLVHNVVSPEPPDFEDDEQPRRVAPPQPNPSQATKAKKLTGVRKTRVR